MSRYDLCIPYAEKDELKKTHKLKFDLDKLENETYWSNFQSVEMVKWKP